jgi:Tol biopolymer transport system component
LLRERNDRMRLAVWGVALVVVAVGAPATAGGARTILIDRNAQGSPADGSSSQGDVSANGRYVAFASNADNLSGGDGTSDVYLRDRIDRTTRLVSRTSGGAELTGDSAVPAVSGDGSAVAFLSDAENLPGGAAQNSVYLRDLSAARTILVSRTSDGVPVGGSSLFPSVSRTGRYVAFESSADRLPGRDGVTDVYVRDVERGITRLVSKRTDGALPNDHSSNALISANGRFVVFRSTATNLPGRADAYDVYRHDLGTGRTILISRTSSEEPANDHSFAGGISGRGRFVAFSSDATNLPGTDTYSDVYVRDTRSGTTRLASQTSDEVPANGFNEAPDISANGRYVAFQSFAENLPGEPGGDTREVYVRDRKLGVTEVVSVSSAGEIAQATRASISGDGRFVSFQSGDSGLPAGGGVYSHVYLRGPLS